MAKKITPLTEMLFSVVEQNFKVVSIHRYKEGNYSIRIVKKHTINFSTGEEFTTFDYIDTDKDGVVTNIPRGFKNTFQNTKIVDIEKQYNMFLKGIN